MSAKFKIEKIDGKWTEKSRKDHSEQMNALPDGLHEISIQPAKEGYSPTRYKHYFDCVLWQILNEAGHHYRIVNLETGEERRPVSTQELHDLVMKPTYNKVLLMAPGKSMLVAGSTTDLDNKEYFGKYLESIIADHSGPPYNIQFIGYEDWKELHRANAWINFKNTYKK